MIHCQRCKTQNDSEALNCQQCGADLLPPQSKGSRIAMLAILSLVGIIVGLIGYATRENFFLYCCSGVGLVLILSGVWGMFRKTPLYERYDGRAKRHVSLDPQQALRDYSKALQIAPDGKMASIIKGRAKLLSGQEAAIIEDISTASRLMQKGRDGLVSRLPKNLQKLALDALEKLKAQIKAGQATPQERLRFTYLQEACVQTIVPEKDYGTDPLQAISTGMSTGLKRGSLTGEVTVERKKLVEEDAVQILGFCPTCKDIKEFDAQMRCTSDGKKIKGQPAYVLPDELESMRTLLRDRQAKS